ncbi:MAG: glycosyltransferase family 4 protein [Anaerolineae bacterium]|nr:glycosyltransferase family 4 protein [Anaerolineae bacterium]
MRIAIDYTSALRQGAGIGRYARELVDAILETPSPHNFVLMAAKAGLSEHWRHEQTRLSELAAAPEQLRFRGLPLTDNWVARLWQRLRVPLPAETITGRVDGFYSPDFVLPPLRSGTRALLTVHDLSFIRHPETFTPALQQYLQRAVPRSVARADFILADSIATHQDLVELLHVPVERVTVLYSGLAAGFQETPEADERVRLQARYGIGARPYILTVGTLQPRKNYIRLMQACDPLCASGELELVIAGKPAWLAEPILEAAAQRPTTRLLGFVADADLPALYRQATAFAFPSLYEGFGLPVIEAMACGTPVVGSAVSSIPEVVGDAGLLVDPLDVDGWRTALQRVCEDSALRAELRSRGLSHARQFSWARAAAQWLALIAEIA